MGVQSVDQSSKDKSRTAPLSAEVANLAYAFNAADTLRSLQVTL